MRPSAAPPPPGSSRSSWHVGSLLLCFLSLSAGASANIFDRTHAHTRDTHAPHTRRWSASGAGFFTYASEKPERHADAFEHAHERAHAHAHTHAHAHAHSDGDGEPRSSSSSSIVSSERVGIAGVGVYTGSLCAGAVTFALNSTHTQQTQDATDDTIADRLFQTLPIFTPYACARAVRIFNCLLEFAPLADANAAGGADAACTTICAQPFAACDELFSTVEGMQGTQALRSLLEDLGLDQCPQAPLVPASPSPAGSPTPAPTSAPTLAPSATPPASLSPTSPCIAWSVVNEDAAYYAELEPQCPDPLRVVDPGPLPGSGIDAEDADFRLAPSACALPCPQVIFPKGQWDTLKRVLIAFGFLGLLGALYTVGRLAYKATRDRNAYARGSTINILFFSLGFVLPGFMSIVVGLYGPDTMLCETTTRLRPNSSLCQAQGFIYVMSGLWSASWCLMVVLELYLTISELVSRHTLMVWRRFYIIICSLIPLACVIAAGAGDAIGPAYSNGVPMCFVNGSLNWEFGVFFGPVFVVVIACFFFAGLIVWRSFSVFYGVALLSSPQVPATTPGYGVRPSGVSAAVSQDRGSNIEMTQMSTAEGQGEEDDENKPRGSMIVNFARLVSGELAVASPPLPARKPPRHDVTNVLHDPQSAVDSPLDDARAAVAMAAGAASEPAPAPAPAPAPPSSPTPPSPPAPELGSPISSPTAGLLAHGALPPGVMSPMVHGAPRMPSGLPPGAVVVVVVPAGAAPPPGAIPFHPGMAPAAPAGAQVFTAPRVSSPAAPAASAASAAPAARQRGGSSNSVLASAVSDEPDRGSRPAKERTLTLAEQKSLTFKFLRYNSRLIRLILSYLAFNFFLVRYRLDSYRNKSSYDESTHLFAQCLLEQAQYTTETSCGDAPDEHPPFLGHLTTVVVVGGYGLFPWFVFGVDDLVEYLVAQVKKLLASHRSS
jgi:hypothetical protein